MGAEEEPVAVTPPTLQTYHRQHILNINGVLSSEHELLRPFSHTMQL